MIRPIPQPDVRFCDPDTGLITPAWYEYFKIRDRVTSGVGGGSSTAVWFYGTSAPSNALGVDGDFYMLLDATTHALQVIRIKQSGVWT